MTNMPSALNHLSAKCPACGDTIEFATTPKLKDVLNCPCCESLLQVMRSVPVLLMWWFDNELVSYEDVYTRPLEDKLEQDEFGHNNDDYIVDIGVYD